MLVLALSESVTVGQEPSPAVVPNSRPEPSKIEGRYSGTWVTTSNKKLNGTAKCEVKQLSKDHWRGRFWGMWERVPFDYTVEFAGDNFKNGPQGKRESSGENDSLIDNAAKHPVAGTATIDGAHYDWTGNLTANEFNIRFAGSRYEGYLELKRVPDP